MNFKNVLIEDDRFSKVLRDSKFKKPPTRKRKVKIDRRFQSMFTDSAFQVKYSVDKRGRRLSKSPNEDLNKFYHVSSSDESESEVEDLPSLTREEESLVKKKLISEKTRKKLSDVKVDYARGEGKLFTDSSSDESESEGVSLQYYSSKR